MLVERCYPARGWQGERQIRDEEFLRKAELEVTDVLKDVAWGRSSWDDVCRLLAATLPGSAPTIVNYDPGTDAVKAAFVEGIADDYVRSYQAHYSYVNPWMEFWRTAPAREVFVSERDSPSRLFRRSEFFVDWLEPQGNLEAAVGTRVEAGASDAVHIAWHYDIAHADAYDAFGATLLERLRPSLVAAVRDAAVFREALELGRHIGPVIDHVKGAAFLVERNLTVRDANRHAVAAMQAGEVVQGLSDTLVIRDAAAHRWLEETAAKLADTGTAAATSLVFSAATRVYRLVVSPLPARTAATSRLLVHPRPMVFVVLQLLVGGELRIDAAALKTAFGLSTAEIRLCEALVNGMSLADAARTLGLSDGTVRQRVKMIFHKTHTHRQGELIAALGRFASAE